MLAFRSMRSPSTRGVLVMTDGHCALASRWAAVRRCGKSMSHTPQGTRLLVHPVVRDDEQHYRLSDVSIIYAANLLTQA